MITSSGYYTVPSGWDYIEVFLVGGGGGSPFVTYKALAGHGSGSGETSTVKYKNAANSVLHIGVGTGGVPSTYGKGGHGGASSVSVYHGSAVDSSLSSDNVFMVGGGEGSDLFKGGDGGSGGGAGGYQPDSDWSNGMKDGDTTSWWDWHARRTFAPGKGGHDGANGQHALREDDGTTIYDVTDIGLGQGVTTRAFGLSNGTLYASGGSGGCTGHKYAFNGSYGAMGPSTEASTSRSANTGDGAHGASGGYDMNSFADNSTTFIKMDGYGGYGGSGIVIIRRIDPW